MTMANAKRTKHAMRKHLAKLKIQTRSSDLFLNGVHEYIHIWPNDAGARFECKNKRKCSHFLPCFCRYIKKKVFVNNDPYIRLHVMIVSDNYAEKCVCAMIIRKIFNFARFLINKCIYTPHAVNYVPLCALVVFVRN